MSRMLCLFAAFGLAAVSAASAQERPYPMTPYSAQRNVRKIEANGRCNGVSYGTGARRCGTRTGGPSGGLTNRN